MNHKVDRVKGEAKAAQGLVPVRRFPEFRGAGSWVQTPLRDVCDPISERVGSATLTPVSITAGRGFVSQASKFGRDISGEQYRNYTYLRQGDFAYNKGNSISYPQGWVCQLKEFEEAAASSAFICFRLHNEYRPAYFQALFDQNVHGRQLTRFITSGARSNGLLNIRAEDFFGVKIPLPPKAAEQQKIADFLSSLDAVIAAEEDRLAALRDHKKGLMQQIFPRPERTENGEKIPAETIPRLRFPEFQNAGDWVIKPLGDTFDTASGGTPDRQKAQYWDGDIPWITTSLVDSNIISQAAEFITVDGLKSSSTKIFPKGTVLVAMYGQGKTRGKVALLGIEAATNQACAAILPKEGIDPAYVFLNLGSRYDEIRALSNSGGQDNLSQGIIGTLPFPVPRELNEQRKVANCLASLNSAIDAQSDKIDTLKTYKSGLMQQLFPSPVETAA